MQNFRHVRAFSKKITEINRTTSYTICSRQMVIIGSFEEKYRGHSSRLTLDGRLGTCDAVEYRFAGVFTALNYIVVYMGVPGNLGNE